MNVATFTGSKSGSHPNYQYMAHQLGKLIAEAGMMVVNGGAGGLLSAVNDGVAAGNGNIISVRLDLEGFQPAPIGASVENFKKLNPRQQRLIETADAYTALPGGIGTLFEVLEIICLKSLNEIKHDVPMILLGKQYWQPQIDAILHMEREGFLYGDTLSAYVVVDRPEEAVEILKSYRKKLT